jgi:hypothetical protein
VGRVVFLIYTLVPVERPALHSRAASVVQHSYTVVLVEILLLLVLMEGMVEM